MSEAVDAVHASLLGIGHVQLAHGPGRTHVAQPAFFLEPVGVVQRPLMREQAVFHAGHEHQRKFQTLGGVQGHQLHAVVPGVALRVARLEHRMGQERRQR